MSVEEVYAFRGVDLTPAIAMPLIKEIMADGRPVHRAGLAQRAAELHRARGGTPGGDSTNRVKKALAMLQAAGEVVNVNHGIWRLPGPGELPLDGLVDEEDDADETAEAGEPEVPQLQIECEIGAGAEAVYVYYFERDKRLARYENRSSWPCKIGFSVGAVEKRILGQGVSTAMYSLPTIGLLIRADKGRWIEKAVHDALRLAGRSIPGSLGTEWFDTTPDAVRRWIEEYQRVLRLLDPRSDMDGPAP